MGVQRSSSSSGAPLTWYQSLPSGSGSSGGHALEPRVEVVEPPAARLALSLGGSTSSPSARRRRAGRSHSDRRCAPSRRPRGGLGVVAAHGGAQQAREGLAGSVRDGGVGVELVAVGPEAGARTMRPSVRVPVLSVQITSVEPSVSTAVSRFRSALRRAIRRTPTASARVMVGSRPSGTLATSRPDREDDRVVERKSGDERADGEEQHARGHGDRGDQLGGSVDLHLERAELGAHTLGERGDPARAGCPSRWRRRRPRPRPRAEAAAEDEVVGLERRGRRPRPRRAARHGCDSPVSGDMSSSTEPVDQPGVGRQPVPLLDQQDVAGHELDAGCPPPRRPAHRACGAGTPAAPRSPARPGAPGRRRTRRSGRSRPRSRWRAARCRRRRPAAAATQSSSASGWVNCAARSRRRLRCSRRWISFGPCCSRRGSASRGLSPAGWSPDPAGGGRSPPRGRTAVRRPCRPAAVRARPRGRISSVAGPPDRRRGVVDQRPRHAAQQHRFEARDSARADHDGGGPVLVRGIQQRAPGVWVGVDRLRPHLEALGRRQPGALLGGALGALGVPRSISSAAFATTATGAPATPAGGHGPVRRPDGLKDRLADPEQPPRRLDRGVGLRRSVVADHYRPGA